MKGSTIIIKKELARVFSDRKLCFSLFLLPAILVIGIYALIGQLVSGMANDIADHPSIVYFVNVPNDFESYCNQNGYFESLDVTFLDDAEYRSDKTDLEAGILNSEIDMVVYFDPDFSSVLKAYSKAGDKIPSVEVSYNPTANYSSRAYSVFSEVISPYKNNLLAERLGNLEILSIFDLKSNAILNEEKANAEFMSMMLPYLVVILLFSGAMSVTVDAIAGEKERGTMSSMLLSPVSRSEIVFGKIVSLAILSTLSAIVYAAGMVLAVPLLGNSMENVGASGFGGISLGFVQILQLIALLVTLVYLFVSIISLLSVLAKDTKTASTLISPCYIVVMLLGLITMFAGSANVSTVKYCIPVYGAALAIKDICACELTGLKLLAAVASSVVPSIIFTAGMTKAFNSEKIMFNA